jgi:hypothetical protein
LTDHDAIGGTDATTTCPECGCVSGPVGSVNVVRHIMTCSRTHPSIKETKEYVAMQKPEMSMREVLERILGCVSRQEITAAQGVDLSLDALMQPTRGMEEAAWYAKAGHPNELDHRAIAQDYATFHFKQMIRAAKEGK